MSTDTRKPSSQADPSGGARDVCYLYLYGPARLEHQGRNVKLTQRSLALLYYLAIEGPTRRDVLSELLWGFGDARNNLRVELSRLRKVLEKVDVDAFTGSPDPLYLPARIELERTPNSDQVLLEGLDDISTEFQYWLDTVRTRLSELSTNTLVRQQQLDELAAEVRPPYLLILSGLPGAGHEAFARELAQRLGLQTARDTWAGTRTALHFLTYQSLRDVALSEQIVHDKSSVWVLEHLAFGDDPVLLLDLREKYPPDRVKFVGLKPLSWLEVRHTLLAELPFAEAARIYIESEGNIGVLKELLALRPPEGFGSVLPLPQRIRAMYLLKAHDLSDKARLVLEPLSVHPGALSADLVRALGAEPYMDELEREGWLRYQDGWFFVSSMIRRVFYQSLQEGRRQRFHAVAAEQFTLEGNEQARSYHLEMRRRNAAAAPGLREELPRAATRQKPELAEASDLRHRIGLGRELALLESFRSSPHVEGRDERIALVKRDALQERVYIRWELPDEPCILHLRGRAYHRAILSPNSEPGEAQLELTIYGKQTRQVTFTAAQESGAVHDTLLTLPLPDEFEYWFNLDEGRELQLATFSNPAVIELELRAYRLAQSPHKDNTVRVYDLNALPSMKVTHRNSP
ncbi:MAG: hypothetical protein U5L04_00440 [Trueperaceae bacterium]|nr:hypothetical protein [Trueperaceae bacterium]